MTIHVESSRRRPVRDGDLQQLLTRAYVGGGFTAPDRAAEVFAPTAVRARGDVLCAWQDGSHAPAGVVIVVPSSSAASRFAGEGEAEMHLLATADECRRMGVGRALVAAAIDHARASSLRRMLLWTQPTMHAAQRLYSSAGFVREPTRDFHEGERHFLYYEKDLTAGSP